MIKFSHISIDLASSAMDDIKIQIEDNIISAYNNAESDTSEDVPESSAVLCMYLQQDDYISNPSANLPEEHQEKISRDIQSAIERFQPDVLFFIFAGQNIRGIFPRAEHTEAISKAMNESNTSNLPNYVLLANLPKEKKSIFEEKIDAFDIVSPLSPGMYEDALLRVLEYHDNSKDLLEIDEDIEEMMSGIARDLELDTQFPHLLDLV